MGPWPLSVQLVALRCYIVKQSIEHKRAIYCNCTWKLITPSNKTLDIVSSIVDRALEMHLSRSQTIVEPTFVWRKWSEIITHMYTHVHVYSGVIVAPPVQNFAVFLFAESDLFTKTSKC